MTQTNTIDLSRRSPSYEMRLAKYRLWGFEIFWFGLDRSYVDPRVYHEPIDQLVGLARLLALERLFEIAPCKARPSHLERGSSFSNTFQIPYGPKYDASKIEAILQTTDLSLNGRPNERFQPVSHHRHPAFWGSLEEIMGDCCGACPPNPGGSDKTFVSGIVSFVKNNPGRQRIGSFYPLTAADWVQMAYVASD